jgi:hypothetical protein
MNKREELRKTYDHYEAKMELTLKENEDIDYLNKVEQKFRKSMEEYADYSHFTYRQIQSLLDYRYNYINVCVTEFVNSITDYYGDCHRICKDYLKDIDQQFELKDHEMEERTNLFSRYNPYIFMKGAKILEEFRKAKNYNQAITMINETKEAIEENPSNIEIVSDRNIIISDQDKNLTVESNFTPITRDGIERS